MAGKWQALNMDAKEDWTFHGGPWEQDGQGLMTRPKVVVDENLAIYNKQSFGDFEVQFDFRLNLFCCGGGLIFRGRDCRQYYLIDFPCTGQQYRAEYFWAAVCKVDQRGWTQVLRTEIVSGAPSEIGWWHRIRLVVQGNVIRLFINGRPFSVVTDDTYQQPGHIGLYSYDGLKDIQNCSFGNVQVRGDTAAPCWDASVEAVQNWYYPTDDETHGPVQHHNSFTRTPGGDLLMKLGICKEFHDSQQTATLIRSSDNGRTWSDMQVLPDTLAEGGLFTTRDGRLIMHRMKTEQPFGISMARSTDDGRTWGDWQPAGNAVFPDDVDQVIPNQLIELKNGTLIWFMYRRTTKPAEDRSPKNGITHWSYCIRSTDGGQTWSQPIDLDGPRPDGFDKGWMIPKHFGSETCAAETRDGKLVSFIRPYFDPVMWETWSSDGGQSWTPIHRGPFGNWACTSAMLATQSGVLFLAGRHPGLAAQISYDDGMTWTCYRFDTTFWANGFAAEIAPDVVMFASTAKYGDPKVRVHLFRMTPDGPVPQRPEDLS